ncbi:MAG: hypothetical protein R6W87_09500 [Halospina sp.]
MSSKTLSLPDIPDSKVVLNEREAREVLAFFWPSKKPVIKTATMTMDLRRYAQALLVVAIDGSYLLGFVHILFNVVFRRKPGTSIRKLITKVTRKSTKHWWKHATEDDLEDPRIYETVRVAIAGKQKPRVEKGLNGLPLTNRGKSRIEFGNIEPCEEVWV